MLLFFVFQASLVTYHFCLGFTIQQCFISASSDSSVVSSYLLIQHSCAADSHVTLLASERAVQDQALPPRYRQRQRLSFVLQPRSNDSIHFLHCRLTLCSREQHDSRKTSGSIPKVSSLLEQGNELLTVVQELWANTHFLSLKLS